MTDVALVPLPPGDTQAFSKEFHGASYGAVFRVPRAPRGTEPARENFTGYFIPPGDTTTVAETNAYYLDGQPSKANSGLTPEELAAWRGKPISGDGTTKARAGSFYIKDLPQNTPTVTPRGHLF